MKRSHAAVLTSVILSLLLTASAPAHEGHSAISEEVVTAANAFLDSLDSDLRQKATFKFDDPVRTDWHFIPKERLGVMFKEMTLEQRRAGHEFMRSVLSNKGYLKAVAVMSLERVLRELESDRPDAAERRDEEKYWFAVFGEPQLEEPWGWRIEGHHLSLNFSSVHGLVVSTPMFFGANPAEVKTGPRAGLRVMGAEESMARSLVKLFDDALKSKAVIDVKAPSDVITGPGQAIDVGAPVGVSAAEMSSEQSKILVRLISEGVAPIAEALKELRKAGPEIQILPACLDMFPELCLPMLNWIVSFIIIQKKFTSPGLAAWNPETDTIIVSTDLRFSSNTIALRMTPIISMLYGIPSLTISHSIRFDGTTKSHTTKNRRRAP